MKKNCLLRIRTSCRRDLKDQITSQRRARGGEYWHLSYSHAGKGHTEYIRKSDVSIVQEELKNHKRLRELISEWIGLETELSKIKRKSRDRSQMKTGKSS